ncbi:hypothetical protein [Hafnia alvei]|nr:hypothetical protein [Hafnia alvei]MBW3477620.1 hypothetical protein [Hafnia alvei]
MGYGLEVRNPSTGKMFDLSNVASGLMSFVTKLEFNVDYSNASSMTFNVLGDVPASS